LKEQEWLLPTGDLLKQRIKHPTPVQETKKINKITHMLLAIE
jgi:hypothetical protein